MMAVGDWRTSSLERIRDGSAPVVVMGCGYVGLTLSVACAQAGLRVLGIEVNEAREKELRAGANPVPDVQLPDGELDRLRSSGHLRFATAVDEPGLVYVICVNTPLRDGSPDLRYIESAGEAVGAVLERGSVVVLESTTYPGTTEELLRPILEECSRLVAGEDFGLAHSPERIDPANQRWTLRNTAKVVGGLTPGCTELVATFYSHVCDEVVTVGAPRTAEIAKLYENTYREVNIALANEMAMICRNFDIDPWEVVEAASTKPYGFTPFRPGPGVGGECIPVDPQYLAWRVRGMGRQFRLLETASDINRRMPAYVVQRAAEVLNDQGKAVRSARILLLGVAYKGGSGDVRESPAIRVADHLCTVGAEVAFHDPHVPRTQIDGVLCDSVELSDDQLASSDLVIVLTDHSDVDYERVLRLAPCVFDTRGVTTSLDNSPNVYRY